jgi:hypothetical protein
MFTIAGLILNQLTDFSLIVLACLISSDRNPPAACRRPKGRFGRKSGRPSAYLDLLVARTIVYIDGFNLYYRALKGTSHKWLDIEAMSRAALPQSCYDFGKILR